jgi:preprotein translocase subunit SecY
MITILVIIIIAIVAIVLRLFKRKIPVRNERDK